MERAVCILWSWKLHWKSSLKSFVSTQNMNCVVRDIYEEKKVIEVKKNNEAEEYLKT